MWEESSSEVTRIKSLTANDFRKEKRNENVQILPIEFVNFFVSNFSFT